MKKKRKRKKSKRKEKGRRKIREKSTKAEIEKESTKTRKKKKRRQESKYKKGNQFPAKPIVRHRKYVFFLENRGEPGGTRSRGQSIPSRPVPSGRGYLPPPTPDPPREGSPLPSPVPLPAPPGAAKRGGRKKTIPSLGSGGGDLGRCFIVSLIFSRRGGSAVHERLCLTPPTPPLPRGRDTKENTGLTPISAWVFPRSSCPAARRRARPLRAR